MHTPLWCMFNHTGPTAAIFCHLWTRGSEVQPQIHLYSSEKWFLCAGKWLINDLFHETGSQNQEEETHVQLEADVHLYFSSANTSQRLYLRANPRAGSNFILEFTSFNFGTWSAFNWSLGWAVSPDLTRPSPADLNHALRFAPWETDRHLLQKHGRKPRQEKSHIPRLSGGQTC